MSDDKKQDRSRNDDPGAKREELIQLFKRGAEFSEELLKENERLRFRVAELEAREASGGNDEGLVKELMDKIRRLEAERDEIRARSTEVEAENRDFASRYVEIEEENNRLMNIYVASYQLHSTLVFDEVLQIITEIILNFVGAEKFAVVLFDEEKQTIHPLLAEGFPIDDLTVLSCDKPPLASVLRKGETYLADELTPSEDVEQPMICIPLLIRETVLGAISIYKFLQQKTQISSLDHELFTLLAGHAATAVFSAKLYTDSQRKLSTIQGLIDLVTS